MKKEIAKIASIYALLILVEILLPIPLAGKYHSTYAYIIKPIMSLILLGLTIKLTKDANTRAKYKLSKAQSILIITLVYLIIKFLLGLIFGYTRSPYSHSIFHIIRNIWSFILPVICMEYVRCKLVLYGKNKTLIYTIITIIFVVIDINISSIAEYFVSGEEAFKFTSEVIIPAIMKNSLCTYIAVTGGITGILFYKIPILLYQLLLPIYPDLDWFFTALIECIVPLIIILSIYRIQQIKVERVQTRRKGKRSTIGLAITISIVMLFVLFVAGVFKYMPIAVLTYSMEPVFTRGDIVIIDKLNEKEKKNIQVGDVIRYQLEGQSIVHRVVKIKKDKKGDPIFITKGDNNNAPDNKSVTLKQVKGVAKFYIPKLGYPSVWFNEFFEKTKKPNVET